RSSDLGHEVAAGEQGPGGVEADVVRGVAQLGRRGAQPWPDVDGAQQDREVSHTAILPGGAASLRVLPSLDATMKSLPLCEHFVTTCDPPVDNPGLSMTVRVVSPSGTAPSRPFGRPTYGVLAPWRRAGPGSAPRRGAPSRSPGPSTRPGSPGSDPPAGGARQVTTRLSRRPGAGGE